MTLKLYAHPLSSYCWKALIALYELGTPFTLELVDFGDPESAARFRALWPLAKMPVLVEADGTVIVESSIVVEHLDLHHPGPIRLVPADPAEALQVRKLDRLFDAYVMTPMQQIVADRLRPADAHDPHGVAASRQLLDTSYAWFERALAGRTWAVGDDFTMADCSAAPSLYYADKVQPFRDTHPVIAGYLARLEARPSFARVLAEAEPYAHMYPTQDLFPAAG
jgi:glutathione S-transferase